MPKRIHIRDHLILPFGTATKNDLPRIKLSSVAANGVYFTSDIPCVYIDKSRKKPLTLYDWADVLLSGPRGNLKEPYDGENISEGLNFIRGLVEECMPKPTSYETAFVRHYFSWIENHFQKVTSHYEILNEKRDPFCVYHALLPIPQMQLYVEDPLEDDWSATYEPSNNFRVDFGFWTGESLIAIEIDGSEPSGYARDVRRDRLLRRAEVDVIHILNTEIARHGESVIAKLLPPVFRNWITREGLNFSPFDPPF
jgi:hypothetical protein